jgi:hypothetical protein
MPATGSVSSDGGYQIRCGIWWSARIRAVRSPNTFTIGMSGGRAVLRGLWRAGILTASHGGLGDSRVGDGVPGQSSGGDANNRLCLCTTATVPVSLFWSSRARLAILRVGISELAIGTEGGRDLRGLCGHDSRSSWSGRVAHAMCGRSGPLPSSRKSSSVCHQDQWPIAPRADQAPEDVRTPVCAVIGGKRRLGTGASAPDPVTDLCPAGAPSMEGVAP